jgi:hypothetical protein
MKQQYQRLALHPFSRIIAPSIDVWLALYLTDPGVVSMTSPGTTGTQVGVMVCLTGLSVLIL